MRRPTVRDIAAASGVSIATVSRVLNGRDNVTAYTRELVQRTAQRLGGPPQPAKTVYVRCPYLLTDYFGLIVSSVAETLSLHGMRLVLDAGEAAQDRAVLATLAEQPGVDAAVLILPPEPAEELERLRSRGLPFVVVDPRTPPPNDVPAVSAGHFTGARRLATHLVELGHRRIAVAGGPTEWLAGDARLSGHRAALAGVGVLLDPRLLLSDQPTVEYGYRAAAELLDLADPPTALVCFNDKVAVGALRRAHERGLRVPADLSIAGFDDIDVSRATRPMLTTVRQPLQEMGRMAVTLLVRLLSGHALGALHIELDSQLVVRDSTGPVTSVSFRSGISNR